MSDELPAFRLPDILYQDVYGLFRHLPVWLGNAGQGRVQVLAGIGVIEPHQGCTLRHRDTKLLQNAVNLYGTAVIISKDTGFSRMCIKMSFQNALNFP